MSFQTDADREAEQAVADALASAWRCELHEFGRFSPIDRFAVRDGKILAVVEIKCYSIASDRFPTVKFSVRKWLALNLTSAGLGCQAIFVVRFTDGIKWAAVDLIPTRDVAMRGHHRPRAAHDLEPLIQFPVTTMRPLTPQDTR
jgi:hypothetical protein